jgi:hypothetical protein
VDAQKLSTSCSFAASRYFVTAKFILNRSTSIIHSSMTDEKFSTTTPAKIRPSPPQQQQPPVMDDRYYWHGQRAQSFDTLDESHGSGANLSAYRFYLLAPLLLWSVGPILGSTLFVSCCCLEYGLKPVFMAYRHGWTMSRDALLSATLGTAASSLFLLASWLLLGWPIITDDGDDGQNSKKDMTSILLRCVASIPTVPLLIVTYAALLQCLAMSSLRMKNKTRILAVLGPLGMILLLFICLS